MVEPSIPELTLPDGDRRTAADMFGGKQGVIDSIVPVTVFVAVNAARRDVTEAALTAVAFAVVLGVVRLVRHEPLKHVLSGVIGVGLSAFIAIRMGEARGFFIPGIVLNAGYFVLFVGSVLVRKPIIGVLARQINDKPAQWHDHSRVRRAYIEATLGWAAVFGTRVLVVGYLTLTDRIALAGVSKLLLGPLLYVVALLATVAFISRRTRGLEPDDLVPDVEDQPVT